MLYQLHWVSLVMMKTSLHKHDRNPMKVSEKKTRFVAGNRRYRKVRNICVVKDVRIVKKIGKSRCGIVNKI